jgi:outer membrane protein
MKKIALLLILFSVFANAQKIGVVDTDYILSKLPQYKEAEERLNTQISAWQKEIQNLQAEYDKKKATLENERVLLVGDQLKQREKEVDDLNIQIKTMLNAKFGGNGEINGARANLAKPFQDQIWNAVKTVAEKNTLGIILDKNENNVLFLDKRYDYTDKVLNLLIKKDSPDKEKEKGKNKNTTPATSGKNNNTKQPNTTKPNNTGNGNTRAQETMKSRTL